jgi:hypothetical protein
LAAFAAALFAACTYPEFGFESDDDDDNGAGAGAGASGGTSTAGGLRGGATVGGANVGAAGGAVSTSTGHPMGGDGGGGDAGAGGAPVVVSVPCGDPSTTCGAGQVCCYHDTTPSLDMCGNKGACGNSYTEFSCNWHDDCTGGAKCCATVDQTFGFLLALECEPACSGGGKLILCQMDAECSDQTCDDFVDSYPGYKWCQ